MAPAPLVIANPYNARESIHDWSGMDSISLVHGGLQ